MLYYVYITERRFNVMKKILLIILCISVVLSCGACTTNTTLEAPSNYYENAKPLENFTDDEIMISQVIDEYFNRTMNIDDSYNPSHIDNETTVIDMKYYIKLNDLKCKVNSVKVYKLEIIGEKANAICVLDAVYSDKNVKKDDYYISFTVDLVLNKKVWDVNGSELQLISKKSETEIVTKPDGEIYFKKKE